MPTNTMTSSELELLTEALHRLRETKVEALETIQQVPGHGSFTPHDFGIPQIDALLAKVDALHLVTAA